MSQFSFKTFAGIDSMGHALESFKLNNNQLESLPNGLTNLIQLKHLELENNLLSELPEDFGNLDSDKGIFFKDLHLVLHAYQTELNQGAGQLWEK